MRRPACLIKRRRVSPMAELRTGNNAGSVADWKSTLSCTKNPQPWISVHIKIYKDYTTLSYILSTPTETTWESICNQLRHYQKYSKNDLIFRHNCTWDSAIVRTIGSTMGCITSLRSSAHNGGSTFIPHQVHQKLVVKSVKFYWIFSNW